MAGLSATDPTKPIVDCAYTICNNEVVLARSLDLRIPALQGSRVEMSDAAATVTTTDGYRVDVERRVVDRRSTGLVRISTPDGRCLDVCFTPTTNRLLSARALISDVIDPVLGTVFTSMTPEEDARMSQRLSAVVDAGLQVAGGEQPSSSVRGMLSDAACSLSDEEYERYAAHMPIRLARSVIARLRDYGIPATSATVFALRQNDSTGDWFPRFRAPTEYELCGKFLRRGWSVEDYVRFTDLWAHKVGQGSHLDVKEPSVQWARVSPRAAVHAVEAGITLSEVRSLLASGEWDEDSVAMLAAFARPV